ncbi:voltage gated chloride channel family protein [Mycobacterium kansasii]|uniref:Voltage gated chloride channel family protein n=1 Tax=Mycobacterium kansasii TaxID=1768 RepID=A0A1V3WBV4_MYCKA|nr:voltage gated chloride channel family protein [Mycobacterium kansasii]
MVGMMACFGSVARAPLAIMIMVAEMTGSFSVVPGRSWPWGSPHC